MLLRSMKESYKTTKKPLLTSSGLLTTTRERTPPGKKEMVCQLAWLIIGTMIIMHN